MKIQAGEKSEFILLVSSDNRFLQYDNRFLYCDNKFLQCDNSFLHCDNSFLHCDTRILHCDNRFVHYCFGLTALESANHSLETLHGNENFKYKVLILLLTNGLKRVIQVNKTSLVQNIITNFDKLWQLCYWQWSTCHNIVLIRCLINNVTIVTT